MTISDIERARGSFSDDFKKRNPHLSGQTPLLGANSQAFSSPVAVPEPEPKKGKKNPKIRQSPVPKTRPEREMALILRVMKDRNEIFDYGFEKITLECGDGFRYTPDFTVWKHDGTLRFIEVKGPHIRRTGLQAYQAAKKSYPKAEFELHQLDRGNWTKLD